MSSLEKNDAFVSYIETLSEGIKSMSTASQTREQKGIKEYLLGNYSLDQSRCFSSEHRLSLLGFAHGLLSDARKDLEPEKYPFLQATQSLGKVYLDLALTLKQADALAEAQKMFEELKGHPLVGVLKGTLTIDIDVAVKLIDMAQTSMRASWDKDGVYQRHTPGSFNVIAFEEWVKKNHW